MKFVHTLGVFGVLIAILISGQYFDCIDDDVTPSGIKSDNIETEIDILMNRYIDQYSVGAAVVIVYEGQVVLSEGYGYGDLDYRTIHPDASIFEFASVSKLFTWTAVMQQVELGRIDLNADIMSYLPTDFSEKLEGVLKYDEPITMLHLMNHTAGFEDNIFDGDYVEDRYLSDNLQDALLKQMPRQVYRPGSVQAYSNFGAALAGYIVECVTSEKLYNYFNTHIFEVLEMHHSVADPRYTQHDYVVSQKVSGHMRLEPGIFAEAPWTYNDTYPDGSINGTAMDLARFLIALMEEDCRLFMHDSTRDQMLTTTYSLHPDVLGCAHGFWNFSDSNNFFHDGGHVGFTTIAAFDPTRQFAVVVLSNTGDDFYSTYGVAELMMGRNREISVAYADLPDISEVTGIEFVKTRRPQSDFTAIYPFISGDVISAKATGDNTILLRGLEYAQVSPYVFRLIDDKDNPVIRAVYDTVYFISVDDQIVGLTYGGGNEYEKVSAFQSSAFLLIQLVFMAAVAAYFLICVAIGIYRKIKKKTCEPHSVFCFWGVLLIANQIILFARMISSHSQSFPSVAYQFHIYINQCILLLSIFLSLWFVFSKKKNTAITSKSVLHRVVSVSLYVLFVAVLVGWGFFNGL